MRLYFELSPNTEPVPWDYQHFLIGALHKWLGRNELHDGMSLYSMSWLTNAIRNGTGLAFPKGSTWFISVYEKQIAEKLKRSALSDPSVCCGMNVTTIKLSETPRFSGSYRFKVASPVLVKKFDGMKLKHLIFSDDGCDEALTQTLVTKLKKANLACEGVKVRFDRKFKGAKTKLVTINGIKNRASICPVIVEGSPEAVQFAWEVGVGHSTGCGFGALH